MKNEVRLVGRLGADPELRFTKSEKPRASFSMATSRNWKNKEGEWQEETTWHRVVLWGRLAQKAKDSLRIGSLVWVEGRIENQSWTDGDGIDRFSSWVVADEFLRLDSKPADERQADAPADQNATDASG